MVHLRDLKWSAVVVGSIVDIGGTMAGSILISVIAAVTLLSPGETPVQLQARLLANPGFLAAEFVMALAFSCLGGFVAARMAKRNELTHAAMTAAICLGLGLVFSLARAQSSLPMWFRVAGDLLVIPVALLGGIAARSVNLRKAAA